MVDHVRRLSLVLLDQDVTMDLIVLVVCVNQISVKGSIVSCGVKYRTVDILAPTCSDGVQNANETDVDCGGTCLPIKQCRELSKCINPSDCITGLCVSNTCQGEYSYKRVRVRVYCKNFSTVEMVNRNKKGSA